MDQIRMVIYNSLTKNKVAVEPIHYNTIRMYSCGPTVYNDVHIGNLATFIRDDILKRTLRSGSTNYTNENPIIYHGYDVRHVMNITDVDDKTIRGSKHEEFCVNDDPIQSLLNLTEKYETVFREDMVSVGNDIDSIEFIKATDTIPEMIQLIQGLLNAGVAYKTDDGIYFSIKKYLESGHKYGLLQKLDINKSKSRIDNDEYSKDNASDFALWKVALDGEPSWCAEFGDSEGANFSMPGRPGWHIECSAMSKQLLGLPFDIHTGGIDLKFPHHENEIAQICGSGSTELARIFVHSNHLLVDNRKMSKSIGNFYTLKDIEKRGFSAMAFRMLVLNSHYRNEVNFSWDSLETAQNRLSTWQHAIDRGWQDYSYTESDIMSEEPSTAAYSDANLQYKLLHEALLHDLNTTKALEIVDICLREAVDGKYNELCMVKIASVINNILGVKLICKDIPEECKTILTLREEARSTNDFDKSDKLRQELLIRGFTVMDTDYGQVWGRV